MKENNRDNRDGNEVIVIRYNGPKAGKPVRGIFQSVSPESFNLSLKNGKVIRFEHSDAGVAVL